MTSIVYVLLSKKKGEIVAPDGRNYLTFFLRQTTKKESSS
jgi:hypothetical protein